MRNKFSIATVLIALVGVGCTSTSIRDSIVMVGQPMLMQPEQASCGAVTVDGLEPIPTSPVAQITNTTSRDKLEGLLLDYIEQLKKHDQRMREQIISTRDKQLAACTKSLQ